ncbi:hypothetical protein ABAC460_20560 [Asticcacaulis sp. AC460]|uniref:hypothetical protein n=1 Tax=Asticcacaulis sp. AC460 TaxID=1282360 RepID=UPI0003C3AFC2|nr:hypothetical protein [Asticcacaulis sp. AC460]ESQ87166.1 hypothetical protein ABAC460_20560 [Asticcacaulis sp. AC460]
MTTSLAALAADLTQRAEIGAEDVLALRRLVWQDGGVNVEEADVLMALNSACPARATEWVDYFVEVMCDHVVHQQKPAGYVDDAKAQWLMKWIDRDGKVDTVAELELLVRVLEMANAVPQALKTYALKQIEAAILTGEGVTRKTGLLVGNGVLDKGAINDTEVELLRRVIYAQAGDGNYIVSRDEAELLFRLKDANLNAGHSAQWPDLFVKAIANHLMAHAAYQPLTRDEQSNLDAYTADTSVSVLRFVSRIFTGKVDARVSYRNSWDDEAAAKVDAEVTAGETDWLTGRINVDGAQDVLETQLLNFIRREQLRA